MTALKLLPTLKLHSLSRSKTFDGEGDNKVFISKRTKLHKEMEQTYEKLCLDLNHNQPMTWSELYHYLDPELRRRKLYLKNNNS